MTSWTVYSVAKLVFIQKVHTQDPLKNIHGGEWDQGVDGAYSALQCGIQVSSDTKNFVAKCIQKKPWARSPVVTLGLVMTAGKEGAEWFISSQVNQFSTSNRFIARKFE